MHIIELNAEQAKIYRALRLKGLKEEPASFNSSYEDEIQDALIVYEKLLNNENQIVFGAFEDLKLVGILTLSFKNQTKQTHIATFGELYVDQEYRGQSISKSMMASAIMRARDLKCEQIHLSVNIKNQVAKRIYTSFGFEIIGMEKEILKIDENNYIDEYRMVLYFNEWKEA